MNKTAKVVGVFILILALLSGWGYYTFLRPDPNVQEELTAQFGESFFSPNPTDVLSAVEESTSPDKNSFTTDFLTNGENKLPDVSEHKSTPPTAENSAPPISEKTIMEKYAPKLSALEQFTNSRLEEIYLAADQEYDEKSRAGTLNHAAWTQKYLQACLNLQASVNPQFYRLVDQMEAEFEANNQPTGVIDEMKTAYSAAKYAKIKELVARAHGE